MLLYTPIAIVGYFVYGSYLAKTSTILDAILNFDSNTVVASKICSVVMVLHILSAFPVVVNPVFVTVSFCGRKKKKIVLENFFFLTIFLCFFDFSIFLD